MEVRGQLNEADRLSEFDPKKAYLVAKEGFGRAIGIADQALITDFRHLLAVLALQLDLFAEAYEHAFNAAQHHRAQKDGVREAIMQNVLGGVYYYIGDNANRLKCNLRGLELCRQTGDHRGLLRALNNTADTYTRLGEYGLATELFEECLSLAGDNSPTIRCIVLSNMGEIAMLKQEFDTARQFIAESQELGRQIDYREIIVSNLLMLAEMAMAQSNARDAMTHAKEALAELDDRIPLKDRAQVHRILSQVHEHDGEEKEALYHYRLYHQLEQSYLDAQKMREVRSIEFKNEMYALQDAAKNLEVIVEERTAQLEQTLESLRIKDQERAMDLEIEQAVGQFSQSLFLLHTVDEVVWDLAKNCISRLGFDDCVIYLLNEEGTALIQKAAYGPKNPIDLDIYNPITIPVGKGIVGTVAATGKYELIEDTSSDDRYIIDDQFRLSEIAVPIVSGKRVLGVIDSEHHQKGFFTAKHLRILQTISALVANRIDRIRTQERQELLQLELIDQLQRNEQLQTKVTRELETKVRERTAEINDARNRIEVQARDIQDSINYASYIQGSLLPSQKEVQNLFPQSFILYLPRDVVSGDFYWVAQKDGWRYLAVADCTGHGVPGALISVLCIEKLEQALLRFSEPSKILSQVNRAVKKALRQHKDVAESSSRDGMDIALICWHQEENRLKFSGAKRPLVLIRGNEVEQVVPTRFSIAGHSGADQAFDQQELMLQPDDCIYLFSDGFTDQFGGSASKKFSSKQLRQLLHHIHHRPMEDQLEELTHAFKAWKGETPQIDDVLLAGLRF